MNGTAPALVLGLSPTGLHVVRTLARRGIAVGGAAEAFQPGLWSRYLRLGKVGPKAADWIDWAERQATGSAPILIPTSDRSIASIVAAAEPLTRAFRLQRSYLDGTAAQMLDKVAFDSLCRRHGLAVPDLRIADRESLIDVADKLPFPYFVKPASLHKIRHRMGGRKGWIIRDQEDLRQAAREIPEGGEKLLLQRIIDGPESEITLCCLHMDARGTPREVFTARKLRQYPPGFGSASLVQSHREPETERLTIEFLSRIDYHGIVAAEFKRDPLSGQLLAIEMNPRPSLWFGIMERSSRDPVSSLYDELAITGTTKPDVAQLDGIRWRYFFKDLASRRFYRRNPNFVLPPPDIEAVGPARGSQSATYAADDTGPTLAEAMTFLGKGLRRVLSRRT